ncbi:MAG: s-methyl-5-thioribose-1-phosphate isomerase [Tissierellia bacterium]|nr:s-methyl-5-thioribose-1-phosphate isomerase [Tissierellia bacterium]
MERIDNNLAFMLQFENVAWYEKGKVKILDRRIYPMEIQFVYCNRYTEVAQSIKDMVTQSAGPYTAAGMGMALAAYEARTLDKKNKLQFLENAAKTISNARPTTRDRMIQVTDGCLDIAKKNLESNDLDQIIFDHTVQAMENRYRRIYKIAQFLNTKIPNGGKIITQCFGETIIGMMLKVAIEENKEFKLYCPETRPFLQGARFTSSVAIDMGFDTTVITDNMVAQTMKEENIDLFTSAADSICKDGYVVNKVGTFQMAIVAQYLNIPYFVTGIPDQTKSITNIDIEYRNPEETLSCHGIKNTKSMVKGYYPAFDITPPKLIDGVVTDQGILSPYDLKSYVNSSTDFYRFAV